jgi:hypothetical protein
MESLNINQVAKMLGRSTKSIRNYIKEGKLPADKFNTPHGLEYRLHFNEVAGFAKLQLNTTIEANIPSIESSKHAGRPTGAVNGVGEVTKLLQSVEREKTELLKELGEFKAQAGYKIGQLESHVKLLEAAKEERDTLKSKFGELEQAFKVRDEDARRLLKMKEYYEGKSWWQFWKGKYKFPKHAKQSA